MASIDRLRKIGFRRWYERQLIECHLWLVSCFVGIIMLASGFEVFGMAQTAARLTGLLLALGGLVLAVFSWRRYRDILGLTERFGEHANCPQCGAYARFLMLDYGPAAVPPDADVPADPQVAQELWLSVCCKACGHTWRM